MMQGLNTESTLDVAGLLDELQYVNVNELITTHLKSSTSSLQERVKCSENPTDSFNVVTNILKLSSFISTSSISNSLQPFYCFLYYLDYRLYVLNPNDATKSRYWLICDGYKTDDHSHQVKVRMVQMINRIVNRLSGSQWIYAIQDDRFNTTLTSLKVFEIIIKQAGDDKTYELIFGKNNNFNSDYTNYTSTQILAYADDALVLLNTQSNFVRLQYHLLQTYCQASNTKLNITETEAFPLSGIADPQWKSFLQPYNISQWFDHKSFSPLRYLGYPAFFSTSQKTVFFDKLLQTITTSCQIHSQRQLFIRGRVTVLNTLILSRLWHVLRLFPLTKQQLAKLKNSLLCRSYSGVNINLPTSLCLPVSESIQIHNILPAHPPQVLYTPNPPASFPALSSNVNFLPLTSSPPNPSLLIFVTAILTALNYKLTLASQNPLSLHSV
ncbi:hypothetical protein BD770DRAFT_407917 [Pilaira anomala]|nr:hypothetical protein BD770DRAFT_407917 [Pilaira anomala]